MISSYIQIFRKEFCNISDFFIELDLNPCLKIKRFHTHKRPCIELKDLKGTELI